MSQYDVNEALLAERDALKAERDALKDEMSKRFSVSVSRNEAVVPSKMIPYDSAILQIQDGGCVYVLIESLTSERDALKAANAELTKEIEHLRDNLNHAASIIREYEAKQ